MQLPHLLHTALLLLFLYQCYLQELNSIQQSVMDITINTLLFFLLFTFDKANLQTEIFLVCFIFLLFSVFSEYLSASIGEILEIILIGFLTLTNTVKIVKTAAPKKIIMFGETSTDRFEFPILPMLAQIKALLSHLLASSPLSKKDNKLPYHLYPDSLFQ